MAEPRMRTLNEIYKKYEGLIKIIVMVAPLAFASWEYLNRYIYVPERMDAFERRADRDSSIYILELHELKQRIITLEKQTRK